MSAVFPAPSQKRFMSPTQDLMKTTVKFLFQREHGRPAKDWDECYKWCKEKALAIGWTNVRQTNTRVVLEYNASVGFRKEMQND